MRRQAAIGDLPAGRGAAIAAVVVVLVVLVAGAMVAVVATRPLFPHHMELGLAGFEASVAAPLPVRTVLPGGAVLYTRTDCPA
ncbi:MAG TPA: hypothetical protein VG520_03575 [Candidatus Dormibacteraeota bacterium]|nr:hypothetical protein [Candidatus Dormibacteraeota bacterium]